MAIILLAGLVSLVSCGKGGETGTTTTAAPVTTTAAPVTTTAAPVTTTAAPVTTAAPASVDLSVFYATWTTVKGDGKMEITSSSITDYEGGVKGDTFTYTVSSKTLDGDNVVIGIKTADGSATFTVFKAKSGYGEYSYMELSSVKGITVYTK